VLFIYTLAHVIGKRDHQIIENAQHIEKFAENITQSNCFTSMAGWPISCCHAHGCIRRVWATCGCIRCRLDRRRGGWLISMYKPHILKKKKMVYPYMKVNFPHLYKVYTTYPGDFIQQQKTYKSTHPTKCTV
jgi:hypothetical protein